MSLKNFHLHIIEPFCGQKTHFCKNWIFFFIEIFFLGMDILPAKLPSWFVNLVFSNSGVYGKVVLIFTVVKSGPLYFRQKDKNQDHFTIDTEVKIETTLP